MKTATNNFKNIDQIVQSRDLELQMTMATRPEGVHEMIIHSPEVTKAHNSSLHDDSGIATTSLIAGVSIALLMRRRRCSVKSSQKNNKGLVAIFSQFRLLMSRIGMAHSNTVTPSHTLKLIYK